MHLLNLLAFTSQNLLQNLKMRNSREIHNVLVAQVYLSISLAIFFLLLLMKTPTEEVMCV